MEKKTNKIVQRFERLTHHQISLIEAHGKRHCPVPNVDRGRTQDNEFLVGDANLVGIANARIADMQKENAERKIASLKKRRRTGEREALEAALLKAGDDPHRLAEVIGWPWDKKNTKPFTEGVLSISHDWFLGEDGKIAGGRVDEFRAFAVGYVRETFGDDLIYARLYLDEKTPHLQFVIAPSTRTPSRSGGSSATASTGSSAGASCTRSATGSRTTERRFRATSCCRARSRPTPARRVSTSSAACTARR